MTDPPRHPDPKPHTTPRWVKVFGVIAVVVILLFVILHISVGPRRHGSHTPPSGGTERGAQRP
ncbi:MAG TPA: hypothetical protein VFS10_13785 [Pyrinomonadaceae bacterium]|nr:hypothetical protein [Pyrinomonadaceae bacterium]